MSRSLKHITSGPAGRDQAQLVKESIIKFREAWHHVLSRFGRIRFVDGNYGGEATIRREAQAWFLDALRQIPSCPGKFLRDQLWPQYVGAMGQQSELYDVPVLTERRKRFQRALMEADLVDIAFGSNSAVAVPVSMDMSRELWEVAVGLVIWSHRFNLRGRVSCCNTYTNPEQRWRLSAWPLRAAEETLWVWYTSPDREKMLKEDPPRWQRFAEPRAGGLKPFEFLLPIHLAQSMAGTGQHVRGIVVTLALCARANNASSAQFRKVSRAQSRREVLCH
jgi:hypothetical protein